MILITLSNLRQMMNIGTTDIFHNNNQVLDNYYYFHRQVAEHLPEIVDFDEVEIVPDMSFSEFDEFDTVKGKSESFHFPAPHSNIRRSHDDVEANYFSPGENDDDDEPELNQQNISLLNEENNTPDNTNNATTGDSDTVSKNHFSFRLKFLEKQKAWVEKAARR
jgi:hypothetical protein